MSEGGKIVRFPGARERRARTDAKARLEAVEQGAVREAFPALDTAKAIGIRRSIEEARASGEMPYRWSAAALHEKEVAVAALSLKDAILEINGATETQVRLDPTHFNALLALIDERMPTSQDDE